MSIRARKGKKGTTYQVRVSYRNQYGIDQEYYEGGFTSKKQAQARELQLKNEILMTGTIRQECTKTLNEVADEFFRIGAGKLKDSTIVGYQSYYRFAISEHLGDLMISKVKYKIIQEFINGLASKYSHNSIRNVKKTINSIMVYAIKNEYIDTNPVALVDLPKSEVVRDQQSNIISDHDFRSVVNDISMRNTFLTDSYVIALYLGYYTGMRLGEVLALSKNDIDFDNDSIKIDKSLAYIGKKADEVFIQHSTKTQSSNATIPMCTPLKDILLEWFQENPFDLICCDENGDFLKVYNFEAMIRRVSKKLGISLHFHMLRHTFTSNLIRSGVSLEVVKELDRHSNSSITLDVYAHANIDDKKKALEKVFSKFS